MAAKSDADSDPGLKQALENVGGMTPAESDSSNGGGKTTELGDTRERLPHELVVDILSRLPANDLWPLRCVSKPWFRLITRDPKFAQSILDRSLQFKSNPPTSIVAWGEKPKPSNQDEEDLGVYLVNDHTECDKAIELDLRFLSEQKDIGRCFVYGICNGMLCLSHIDKHEVYIWNPLTKDHITIPYPPTALHSSGNEQTTVFGFGFLQSANQYKVIKLVGEFNWGELEYHTQLSVCTLGMDSDVRSWETVHQDILYNIDFTNVPFPHINGVVHWLARKDGELPFSTIIAFDLEDQWLYEIDPPINLRAYGFRTDMLCVQELGGSLCLFNAISTTDVHIWTMKLDDDGSYSWNKHFTVGTLQVAGDFFLLIPLGVVAQSGDIILIKNSKGLITYNLNTNTINHLKEFGFPICNALTYVASIISPRVISGAMHIMT